MKIDATPSIKARHMSVCGLWTTSLETTALV
jgi:hypothetical protein